MKSFIKYICGFNFREKICSRI